MAKPNMKAKAIELRKTGLSYREIMQQIPVAKSTLSEWLHSVGLAKHQIQRLTEKKLAAVRRGAKAKRDQRIARTKTIMNAAKNEVGAISRRELWLIGTMLYWAEGAKQKEHNPSHRVSFNNTDPNMIRIFLRWLTEICGKDMSDITLSIYIHAVQKQRTQEIINFWAKAIACDPSYLQHVYYKKGNPKTIRRNVGATYHGTFRIDIKSSTEFNRQIAGWTQGVVESIR